MAQVEKWAARGNGGDSIKPTPLWWSARMSLAGIAFLGFLNLYAQRVNMSVAVVCMVNNTAPGSTQSSGSPDQRSNNLNTSISNQSTIIPPGNATDLDDCSEHGFAGGANDAGSPSRGEFHWDKPLQGLILSSFFWGYIVMQIPGGWLADRFGGRRVFGYCMLVCALGTLLTPVCARTHPMLLVAVQVLKGLGSSVAFPAMHSIWASWAPPLERTKLVGFTYAGAQIGNVLTFPLSGLLCRYGFDGGWPSIFYVTGTLGVIWFLLWMLISADSPAQHRRISDREREYIEGALGPVTMESLRLRKSGGGRGTPWRTIFTSPACWAIFLANTCSDWETYTLLTNMPTYMSEVLKFDITTNGLFSAIPYIGYWLCINISGVLADFLRRNGYMTTRNVRKLFQLSSMLVSGALLIATGHISCSHRGVAIALLTLALSTSAFQYAGFVCNPVDIAPSLAGTLLGVSSMMSTLSGIAVPAIVGLITTNSSQSEWQQVFYLAAAVCIAGAIFFAIFAQGEVQPWARDLEPTPAAAASSTEDTTDTTHTAQPPPLTNGATGAMDTKL